MNRTALWSWDRRWTRFYRRALPAYWLFLFCATHFPRLRLDGPIPETDKLAHVVAFGALALFFWKFFESNQRPLSGRFVWIALPVLAAYAALDEYSQQFVGRTTSMGDWIANLVGIVAILGVLEGRRRIRARSDAHPSGRQSNPPAADGSHDSVTDPDPAGTP